MEHLIEYQPYHFVWRLYCIPIHASSNSNGKPSFFNDWTHRHMSLVGALEHALCFRTLGIIIPIDFHIVQRGRLNHQQGHIRPCVSRWEISSLFLSKTFTYLWKIIIFEGENHYEEPFKKSCKISRGYINTPTEPVLLSTINHY